MNIDMLIHFHSFIRSFKSGIYLLENVQAKIAYNTQWEKQTMGVSSRVLDRKQQNICGRISLFWSTELQGHWSHAAAERRWPRLADSDTGEHSSARYGGSAWCRHLYTRTHTLYSILCWTGSQCSRSRTSVVMWSNFCSCSMIRAAALRTFCRGWTLAALTAALLYVAIIGWNLHK